MARELLKVNIRKRRTEMSDLNKVFLMGRIGNEPELKASQQGRPYLQLSLATHGVGPEKKETTYWHRVVAFGTQAEVCSKYLSKGSRVLVEGTLESGSYTDKDGKKMNQTTVIAYRVQFISTRSGKYADDSILVEQAADENAA
jgi:single-strand DNA-binding protein